MNTLEPRFTAVQLRDASDDRQPQTTAAALFTVAAALKEPIEHLGLIFGGDPWAGVGHDDSHSIGRGLNFDTDLARSRRESQGVVQKI